MISGTPLTTSIGDLNGELQFLRVWPFSLSDKDDGFWEHRIGRPFSQRQGAALDLLDPLLSVVMIRHSKSQRHLDGRKLTSLPANSIQWQGLPLGRSSAAYVYLFIEEFAASQVARRIERGALTRAEDEMDTAERKQMAKIRALLTMLRRACTDPRMIKPAELDAVIRVLESRGNVAAALANGTRGGGGNAIAKLNGEQILQVSVGGGLAAAARYPRWVIPCRSCGL